MLVVVSFHLIQYTCVCELLPFARRENHSQVGDRVVTAILNKGKVVCVHIL